MKSVFGETKFLKASARSALERLATKRTHPNEPIDPELVKRASKLAAQIGQQVGLLIGRDGRITHVVVGTKDRIYLPDLGRHRLNKARLRRLRLAVFLPDGQKHLRSNRPTSFLADRSRKHDDLVPTSKEPKRIQSPVIADDLLTDLEKLRFDAVMVFAVKADGSAGPVSFAYLDPIVQSSDPFDKLSPSQLRGISFISAHDIYSLDVNFEEFVVDLEQRFTSIQEKTFDVTKDQAILVGAYTGRSEEAKASMDELFELAQTAGIQVVDTVSQRRRNLDPKTVVGKGKLESLMLHALDMGADLLVFDRELSPTQLRVIAQMTELRVIDRSMLILDIFAQRAVSAEGRMQVELAQLKYSLPRLSEKQTALSRLTGGIGGRGPGETKLEIGRRRARDRISSLEKRIDKLAAQRGLRRQRRQSRGVPVIAIVGYTNAGKSTLLNSLTKGKALVENKLFATLDPSSRRMRFPNDREVVFVDTVGFIRELPKELVSAFRATLEEVNEADLLVHLVDASNPEFEKQIEVVVETLNSLDFGKKPRLLVFNKVDLLSDVEVGTLVKKFGGLAVSAVTRQGFEEYVTLLQDELAKTFDGQDPGRFTEQRFY